MTRENELLRKIEKGDASCWEELAAMYYDDILRYCLYHTRDRETAEDAVQETFLKVIRYFPRYKNKGKFRAFLYKVASNTCVDTWRQSREMHLTEQIEYQEAGFAYSESEEGFRQIVETLPEDQREVYTCVLPMILPCGRPPKYWESRCEPSNPGKELD